MGERWLKVNIFPVVLRKMNFHPNTLNRTWTDHLSRQITVPKVARRVVSLCPSVTETLFALGAGAQVAGRTRFCIHPAPEVKAVPVVGGTKSIHFEKVAALKPDLILAVKEENTPEMVEALAVNFPVAVLDVNTLGDCSRMVRDLGELTGTSRAAAVMAGELDNFFERSLNTHLQTETCLYLIWKGPYMAAGPGTFIHEVLRWGGWENAVKTARYPEVTLEEMQSLNPDWVLLSSEPWPFKEKDLAELQQVLPGAKVRLVDGEMFSWYGARMLHSAGYLSRLLTGQ